MKGIGQWASRPESWGPNGDPPSKKNPSISTFLSAANVPHRQANVPNHPANVSQCPANISQFPANVPHRLPMFHIAGTPLQYSLNRSLPHYQPDTKTLEIIFQVGSNRSSFKIIELDLDNRMEKKPSTRTLINQKGSKNKWKKIKRKLESTVGFDVGRAPASLRRRKIRRNSIFQVIARPNVRKRKCIQHLVAENNRMKSKILFRHRVSQKFVCSGKGAGKGSTSINPFKTLKNLANR